MCPLSYEAIELGRSEPGNFRYEQVCHGLNFRVHSNHLVAKTQVHPQALPHNSSKCDLYDVFSWFEFQSSLGTSGGFDVNLPPGSHFPSTLYDMNPFFHGLNF